LNNSKLPALDAALALAIMRIAVGALFFTTFFENLHKDLYTTKGYAGLIHYYIQYGHAPAAWRQVMGLLAAHAAIAGPMQALLESSLGVLLIIGLLSRPAALVAFGFLTGLWISEWGLGWYWELLMPMIVAVSLALGPSGQRAAIDPGLARRWPWYPF
jgi:uncharacterized membrane protein YphA (DoxX/SURF4 family)